MSALRRALVGLLTGVALAAAAAPSAAQTVCEGRPSSGSLRGARALQERPYLRIKRGSEARAWGHPILLQLLNGSARAAAAAVPGSVALIGDLSAKEGGPLSGHASHQAGRDADVGFFVSDDQGRPVELQSFEPFGGDGRSTLSPGHVFDAYRNWALLRAWLAELRVTVTHVFVSAELRDLLIAYGRQSPEFLRYVPLAERVLHAHPAHADHFHVRIACPSDQNRACLDDAGVPGSL